MTFPRALIQAKAGARIRRECWASHLVWRDGRLHWDLPAGLLKQCFEEPDGSSRYRYWEADEIATDWLVETVSARRAA